MRGEKDRLPGSGEKRAETYAEGLLQRGVLRAQQPEMGKESRAPSLLGATPSNIQGLL